MDALFFDMGNLDMVLRIEWLQTLGDVVHNWETQSIRFQYQGHEVCLKGTSLSSLDQSSLQSWLTRAEVPLLFSIDFVESISRISSELSKQQSLQLQQR